MSALIALFAGAIMLFFVRRILTGLRSGWMRMPARLGGEDPYFCRVDEPRLFWSATVVNGLFVAIGVSGFLTALFHIVTGK